MEGPAARYQPSGRPFPETLPDADAPKLQTEAPKNNVSDQTSSKPEWAVYFCHKKVRVIESAPPN